MPLFEWLAPTHATQAVENSIENAILIIDSTNTASKALIFGYRVTITRAAAGGIVYGWKKN